MKASKNKPEKTLKKLSRLKNSKTLNLISYQESNGMMRIFGTVTNRNISLVAQEGKVITGEGSKPKKL